MKKQKYHHDLEQFLKNGISSDSIYRSLFETTENLSLIFNEKTIILKVNSKFAELIGYTKEEVEGRKSWMDFVIKEDLDMMLKYNEIRDRSPQKAPKNYEFRVKNSKGEILLMYITIGIIPGTKYRIASLMDITSRRQMEKEIIQISEEEQRRIGFHLHDDLAPHLLGIEALVNVVMKKLAKEKSGTFNEVEMIRKLIIEAAQKTRGFAKELCPVHLADYGLEAAIRELAKNTELMYGVKCSVHIEDENHDGSSDLSKNIFFIVKEAVHNSVKHSGAKNISIRMEYHTAHSVVKIKDNCKVSNADAASPGISISMEYHPAYTIVNIKDDGKGFNAADTSPGIGLRIMKYRAEMIGAFFEISSHLKKGTTVHLNISHNYKKQ